MNRVRVERSVRLLLAVATTVSLMPTASRAQEAPPMAAADEIVVTGSREGTLDLKRLLDASSAFKAGRATFAPHSVLKFQLRPASRLLVKETRLVLRGEDDRSLEVAIDEDGRFTLPDLPSGRWELVHNLGKQPISVRPLVLSPGSTEFDRPLGDLRLQCRVSWQVRKNGYSFFSRAGFGALGGCSSTRFAFVTTTPRPITAAHALTGGRTLALTVTANRVGYQAPLGDKSLPNGTRILATPAT